MEETNLKKCRNCTYDLKKGISRCPYCGILNPTIQIKEIFITIFSILIVMSLATYIIK